MVTLPESSHIVHTEYETIFLHDQEVQKEDLQRLYENAKRDQWNASTYIDWAKPVDLEQGFVADELIDIYDSLLAQDERRREAGDEPPLLRLAPQPAPPRRARRRPRLLPACQCPSRLRHQVLYVHPGHGRSPPHRVLPSATSMDG